MSEAERIAKGLTKAQMIALPHFPATDAWFFAPTLCGRKAGNIASSLYLRGLFTRIYDGGAYMYRWTPLGREVAAVLSASGVAS